MTSEDVRPIDANAIDPMVYAGCDEYSIEDLLGEEPTLDYAPVNHEYLKLSYEEVGAFETTRTYYFGHCSSCGRKIDIVCLTGLHKKENWALVKKKAYEDYPYCHCGARMDESYIEDSMIIGSDSMEDKKMKPVDADSLKCRILSEISISENGFAYSAAVMDRIETQPTLDVEPVVHCRDCVFFNTTEGNPKCDCMMALAGVLNGSDYCSRGIRKG